MKRSATFAARTMASAVLSLQSVFLVTALMTPAAAFATGTQTGCIEVLNEAYTENNEIIASVPSFTFRLDNGTQKTNDAGGYVRFDNISEGPHIVSQVLPSNFEQLSVTPPAGYVHVQDTGDCSVVVFKNRRIADAAPQVAINNDNYNKNNNVNTNNNANSNTQNVNVNVAPDIVIFTPPPANINVRPSFEISKTDHKETARPGEELTYDITVQNMSDVPVSNVRIVDTLPADVIFNSASDDGNISGRRVTWSYQYFYANESKTYTVRVSVPSQAKNNTVLVNHVKIENGPEAEDTTTVRREVRGGILLEKFCDRLEAQPGDTVRYTLQLTNSSQESASIYSFTDTFDANQVYVENAGEGLVSDGEITYFRSNISAMQTITLTYVAVLGRHLNHGDTVSNTVTVSGSFGTKSASCDIRIITKVPQTGLGAFTGPLNNGSQYLGPLSASRSPVALVTIALLLTGLGALGFVARKAL